MSAISERQLPHMEVLLQGQANLNQLAAQWGELNQQLINQLQIMLDPNLDSAKKVYQATSPEQMAHAWSNWLFEQSELLGSAWLTDIAEMAKIHQLAVQAVCANGCSWQTQVLKFLNFSLGLVPTPFGFKVDDLIKNSWCSQQELLGAYEQWLQASLQPLQQMAATKRKN